MADQTAVIRAFADFARTIAGPYEIGDVLFRLTDRTAAILDIDGAGVSLSDAGELKFVSATDDRTIVIEEHPVDFVTGPCLDSYRSGDFVTSADLSAEERWPDYTPFVLGQGFRSVAGIPMMAAGTSIGALNLYRHAPGEWPADELEIAGVLADMASGYIVNARTLSAREQLATQLQHALNSRVIIEQAKGVLAGRTGTNPEQAFNTMRGYARRNGRKLHDVAHDIVERDLTIATPPRGASRRR